MIFATEIAMHGLGSPATDDAAPARDTHKDTSMISHDQKEAYLPMFPFEIRYIFLTPWFKSNMALFIQ